MNLRAGFPYWLIKHGLPFDYPKVEGSLKTDVLIIGGGISGALAAYHLCEAGMDCMVLDGRTIGLGSTCASTALLQYEIDTPLSKLVHITGYENAVRAYKLCEGSIMQLEAIARKIGFADFRRAKSLYYAEHKKDIDFLKKEFDERYHAGFKVSYLEEKEISEKFGFQAPGAILSASGAEVNSYMFTHYLLQHGIKKGLKVYDRSPVKQFKYAKRHIVAITENGYEVKAKKIVNATGYEVVNFIDKKIVVLHSTYATISEQNSSRPLPFKGIIIWNTAVPYLYMRTTAGGRILVGGRDEHFFSPLKRDKLIGRKTKQLTKDFNKLFPKVEFRPEFSWAGTFGATSDGLPFIGQYRKVPRTYFSLGFGGNGITFSQVAAVIITDLLTGKRNHDASIFSFDRMV